MTTATAQGVEACLETARELAPLIQREAPEAERAGALTPGVVHALRESGLTRIAVMPDLGGGGLDLADVLRVISTIAAADGTTGWNFAFLAMGPAFGHFLPHEVYKEIFANPEGSIVGTLAPTARAVAVDGGFRVSGTMSYCSAHVLSTHVATGATVIRDGAPAMVNGMPEMRTVVLPRAAVTVAKPWDAAGMRATGSDDLQVSDSFVPLEWSFAFPRQVSPWREGPWGHAPLMALLGPGIAAVVVGAARGCVEAYRELATRKTPAMSTRPLAEQPSAQMAIAEAEGLCLAAAATLDDGVRRLWAACERGAPVGFPEMASARLSNITAARLAQRACNLVADNAGMNTALTGNPIDRFVRDIRTMMQHLTFNPARFETTGRILMGLEPGSMVI